MSAGFVNDTGDWVLAVALPIFVFVETRSGSATALLFVCQLIVSAALGPIGGGFVDRWDLRRTLIATNLAQAVTILPLLAVTEQRIWPAYIVMTTQVALQQLNNPANVALIPRVVESEQLTGANAALAASSSLARLIGAPVGGLLVAWNGLGPVVAIDAASFVLVALTLAFLRSDTSPLNDPDALDPPRLRDGIDAVRHRPPLARLLAIQGITQIAQGGFVVLFVAFVVETLDDDGRGLGLIRGTMAIGALVGAAMIGRVGRRLEPTVLYSAGLLGMGFVALCFWNAPAVSTALWVYLVLFALSGVPGAAVTVGLITTVQTLSPADAIGRIVGLMGSADAIGTAIGAIAAGALIDQVGLMPLLDAQAAIYIITGTAAWILITPRRASRPQTESSRCRIPSS